jgi:phosphatidylglycerophosphate synthase
MHNFTTNNEYRKTLKKSAHPLISHFVRVNRWINRPLAWPLVQLLKPTRITPNQVSVVSFLIGMVGVAFFTMGSYKWFVAAGILSQLSSIVDCVDGMLARAKDMGSEFGKYLDIFLDRIVDFSLMAALSYGLYRSTGRIELLILGLLGCAVYNLHVCLYYITINYFQNQASGETGEMRALLLLLIFVFAVINRLEIGLWIFLIFGVIINLYIIIDFIRIPKKKAPLT